ncbi:MAG: hemolysin family protein [Solirubrobacteraceae bacterium]
MLAVWIVLTGVLVLVNTFFVVGEYSLVRSRTTRLQEMADDGRRSARLALAMIDDIGDYIAASQIGITMASLGIGALGEPALSEALKPAFGALSHEVAVVIAVIIAYLLITVVQSVIGEIAPKLYTIQHAERVACLIARPLYATRMLFAPFIVVLNAASYRLVRLTGTDPDADPEHGTPEDIKRIIADSRSGGAIDVGEANMLTGVFHLHEQEARQVMTPIPAVVTVDLAETVRDALRRCVQTGHSRLVVTEDGNQDRVKGIVHVNQLVKLMMSDGYEAHFDGLVRAAPIVPETKPLDDLLADLQRERTELSIVIDEYGRTAGIVTTEDIVEEVVGEVYDETDPAGGAVRQLANGDWFVRGHVALTDLEDYGLHLPVDTDAFNSIGGFVFAQLGRLPKRGDQISADGYSIRVESVRQNRVEAVRIRRRKSPVEGGPAA